MTITSVDALNGADVAPEIWRRFPDYRVHLMTIDGVHGTASNAVSEAVLSSAEQAAAERCVLNPVDQWPEIAVWREAFLEFGVKHRVARSSVESLIRRAAGGLPRIDFLTDVYNAVSVTHCIPLGGEDLDRYEGVPRLTVAEGHEHFDARENGHLVTLPPESGEIIWRDDSGVTCRRWNWRQGLRTRLADSTQRALFIFDGMGDESEVRLDDASVELARLLSQQWPEAQIAHRRIRRPD